MLAVTLRRDLRHQRAHRRDQHRARGQARPAAQGPLPGPRDRTTRSILGWSQQVFTVLAELVAANANLPQRHDRHPGRSRQGRDGRRDPRPVRRYEPDDDRLPLGQPHRHRRPRDRRAPDVAGDRRPVARGRRSGRRGRSRRCSRSPTTRAGGRSRTTSSPSSATRPTSTSRGWSGATRSQLDPRRRPHLAHHRPDLPPVGPLDRLHGAARLRRRRDLLRAALPALAGRTFGDALLAFEDSTLIGLQPAGGAPQLNPPMDTVIGPGDQVIVIGADDDTVRLASRRRPGRRGGDPRAAQPGRRRRSAR